MLKLFTYMFPSGCAIPNEKRKSSLVLLEMMLHIIDHHHALHKLSALELRAIHNRMARLWKTHRASILITAWKILNPSEAIGKYSKFNYVFRLCFIAAHHLINTAHLGIHQGKYCKLVVSTKCCHISNRNCPLPSIKYSPTLAGVTGSYKYLWKCIWLLIWELLRLLLFFFSVMMLGFLSQAGKEMLPWLTIS